MSEPVAITMLFVSIVCDLPSGGDRDLAGPQDLAGALEHVDLVLLHQELDALDVAVDALLLEVHHRGKIELRRGDRHAHLGEGVPGFLEHLGRVQQRLRRHAADIEAGAAEGCVLFDHGDFHAELGCAHRADITARSGADDDEIVGSHERKSRKVRRDEDVSASAGASASAGHIENG
ncbi:hypothetical protein ACVIG9_006448 [Bradyrhizobium ottawaense]